MVFPVRLRFFFPVTVLGGDGVDTEEWREQINTYWRLWQDSWLFIEGVVAYSLLDVPRVVKLKVLF